MPVYSYKRPVKVLVDDSSKYQEEHLTHFFNKYCAVALSSLPKEQKERVYKMLTEHEEIIVKLFGAAITNSDAFIPHLHKKGVTNELTQGYKEWLAKQ